MAALREQAADVANVDAGLIGVLVPITGPSAAIGQRVVAAVEIALAPWGSHFVVEARDTGGDEATTREAVRALVDESRAVAIVGPVEARVGQAAAQEAAALGVPLLSLNGQRDVADGASCLFRDYPTFGAEVAALVEYAWTHARGRRFAVLRGEGRYGELIAQAVADEVERRGGELVDIPAYEADRTEFVELARDVRRARADVIVFADSAARVALIAPALAYEDVWPQAAPHDPTSRAPTGPRREALYLLPSAAADTAGLAQAKRYVEGAVAALASSRRRPSRSVRRSSHPSSSAIRPDLRSSTPSPTTRRGSRRRSSTAGRRIGPRSAARWGPSKPPTPRGRSPVSAPTAARALSARWSCMTEGPSRWKPHRSRLRTTSYELPATTLDRGEVQRAAEAQAPPQREGVALDGLRRSSSTPLEESVKHRSVPQSEPGAEPDRDADVDAQAEGDELGDEDVQAARDANQRGVVGRPRAGDRVCGAEPPPHPPPASIHGSQKPLPRMW